LIDIAASWVNLNGNKISGGSFLINMNTIVVADITDPGTNKKLVWHLFSDDFFSVEKFPQSKLEIKKSELKSGDNYRFVGELTIKGIAKPVEFDAKVNVSSGKLTATGVITVNRTLYDIKYRSGSFFSDLGDKMIYDDFTLEFELIADKK
jgi:polyisoprenoid-binding protein YceI